MIQTDEERSAINRQPYYRVSHVWFLLIALILAGCGRTPDTIDPTRTLPTSVPPATPLPPLPTVAPLGSEENPVQVILVVADEEAAQDAAVDLEEEFREEAGLVITISVTENAADARRALCSRSAHMVTLDAFNYLTARAEGCGAPTHVLSQNGQTQTQGQLMGWGEFDAFTFRGTICRPDSNSIHGWIIPTLEFRARGVDTFTEFFGVVDTGSDEGVIRGIDERKCDLGATTLGAEALVTDLEFEEAIHVLADLTPVPNPVVVLSASADADLQAELATLVTDHTDEVAELMGGEDLQSADDTLFDGLRQLFERAGVDPAALGN